MKKEQMTDAKYQEEIEKIKLSALMAHGTLTIRKEAGNLRCMIETDMHPLFAFLGAVSAVEELFFESGHTEGKLQPQLDRESVENMMRGLADIIVEDVLTKEEAWQKEHGKKGE